MRRVISHGSVNYLYDFDLLSVEQACLAEEVFEFKRLQLDKPGRTFSEVLISGGADYLMRCLGCLIIPCDSDGRPTREFNRSNLDDAYAFVRTLPASTLPELQEVVNDFFQSIGQSELASSVLSRGSLDLKDLIIAIASNQIAPGMQEKPMSSSGADAL